MPFFVRRDFSGSGFDLSAIGSNAAQQVYGIQSGKLAYPSGIAENLAIQNFDPPSGFPISTYTTQVKGFSTDLDCEILHLGNATKTYLPYFSIAAPYFIVNITAGSCHIQNAIVGEGADHNYFYNDNVNENYQGRFQNFTCNTGGDNSLPYPLYGNSSSDHRFLLSMALLQWTPHLPVSQPSSIWVKNLTAVLCKPIYRINNYSISYTQAHDRLRMQAVIIPGTNSTLKGFDDSMLIRAVQASFKNITFGQGGEDYVVTEVPSFFQVMKAMHNVSILKPFMDPSLLRDLGSRIFQEASANIASNNLMVPQDEIARGSLTYIENRLQVKRLTVGLMATCLGLLICISILEVFVRPWDTVSREPNSISSLSTILAASRILRECLASTGSATLDDMQRRLSGYKFQTVIFQQQKTSSFVLEPVADFAEMAASPPSNSVDAKVEWWRPTAVTTWFTALVVVLPLLFIVLLEVLQHVSDSRNGIVEVSNSKFDSQILSTYLPAFVTLVLAMLYTSLDSAISIFAPLAALRRGNVPATRSIMVGSVGKLPPFALFQSLRSRHFAQCLTILGAFVSTLLAIVVSALYTVETSSKDQTVILQQADFFNWTHVDLSQDDGFAGSVTNLVLYENTSYPQWTYNNLVLPSLRASSANMSAPFNGGNSIVVKIPAIRGSLSNCSAVPPQKINITAEGAPPSCAGCNDLVGLNFMMALPDSLCGFDSRKPTTATWSQSYAAPNDSSIVYAGKGTSLRWTAGSIVGDGGIILDHQSSSIKTFSNLDNAIPGCPSVSYSLGMARAGAKIKNSTGSYGVPWSSKQNITVVYCYQRLEQVMTNVTFSYPDFKINSTIPPIPLEETAIIITQNKTQHWFHISINTLINSLQKPSVSSTSRNYIDGFIQALSMGPNGVSLDQLYNNGDVSRLNAAANSLYGRYIAQAISAKMRTNVPPNSTNTIYNIDQKPSNYTATLHRPTKRLHQNRGPKIALQAMLAFLAVCAMATYIIMDTRRVVPHNPCSIAGTMSLLAESHMCRTREVIPEGSEWQTDEEDRSRRSEGMFGGGLMLRMGWWGVNGDFIVEEVKDKKRIFGIDVVARGDSAGK